MAIELPVDGYRVVRRFVHSIVVRLYLDDENEVTFDAEEVTEDCSPSSVELKGAFGFFFAKKETLLVEQVSDKDPVSYIDPRVTNPSSRYFHPDCEIGTAGSLMQRHSHDTQKIMQHVTKEDDVLILLSIGDEPNIERVYMPYEAGDQVLPREELEMRELTAGAEAS